MSKLDVLKFLTVFSCQNASKNSAYPDETASEEAI